MKALDEDIVMVFASILKSSFSGNFFSLFILDAKHGNETYFHKDTTYWQHSRVCVNEYGEIKTKTDSATGNSTVN